MKNITSKIKNLILNFDIKNSIIFGLIILCVYIFTVGVISNIKNNSIIKELDHKIIETENKDEIILVNSIKITTNGKGNGNEISEITSLIMPIKL